MSAIDWKFTKRFLKVNKEGIISGAAVGAAFAFYLKAKGTSLMAAVASKGIIDNVMSRAAATDVAFMKVLIVYMVVGAFIGCVLDAMFKPNK